MEFRFAARQMYKGLLQPSCQKDPALDRSVVLAKETASVGAVEARLRNTRSAYQLQVAREDFEQSEKGCWNDDDPAFAQKHIEMARDEVKTGLRDVERLASSAPPLPTDTADSRLPKAAAYRALVRTAVTSLTRLCELTPAAPNDEVLAQARDTLGKYKADSRSSPYARQFAMAEADTIHVLKDTVVDCMEPENQAAETVTAAMLRKTHGYIDQMTAISRPTR